MTHLVVRGGGGGGGRGVRVHNFSVLKVTLPLVLFYESIYDYVYCNDGVDGEVEVPYADRTYVFD